MQLEMVAGDSVTPREYASSLQCWLNAVGSKQEGWNHLKVKGHLARVLRISTQAASPKPETLRLTCSECDFGEGFTTEAETTEERSSQITPAPALPVGRGLQITMRARRPRLAGFLSFLLLPPLLISLNRIRLIQSRIGILLLQLNNSCLQLQNLGTQLDNDCCQFRATRSSCSSAHQTLCVAQYFSTISRFLRQNGRPLFQQHGLQAGRQSQIEIVDNP
jgi:hypothetical protein